MPAYLIVDLHIRDTAGFEEYRKLVPATIERYGGRFLVRGGKFDVLEGDWTPKRLVVLEFPTMEQARRWYESEEYRQPKALRLAAALEHHSRRRCRSGGDGNGDEPPAHVGRRQPLRPVGLIARRTRRTTRRSSAAERESMSR